MNPVPFRFLVADCLFNDFQQLVSVDGFVENRHGLANRQVSPGNTAHDNDGNLAVFFMAVSQTRPRSLDEFY